MKLHQVLGIALARLAGASHVDRASIEPLPSHASVHVKRAERPLSPREVGALQGSGKINRYEAAMHHARHYASLPTEALATDIYPTWADGSAMPYVAAALARAPSAAVDAARRVLEPKLPASTKQQWWWVNRSTARVAPRAATTTVVSTAPSFATFLSEGGRIPGVGATSILSKPNRRDRTGEKMTIAHARGLLVAASALGLFACAPDEAARAGAGDDVEQEIAGRDDAFKIAPWTGLYASVDSRPISVCVTLFPGTTLGESWTNFVVRTAVNQYVDAVQPVVSASLFRDPVFSCQYIDGHRNFDLQVDLRPYTSTSVSFYDWGTRTVALFDGAPRFFYDALHEFGHAFGLDDTYMTWAGVCQPNHPNSVMCGGSFSSLQPDDINGAQQVFRLTKPWLYHGPTILRGNASGRCLDVAGHGTANGSGLQLWDCAPTSNQVWSFRPDGSIVGQESGKCLDVVGYGTANGTPVQMWDCTGASNQRWEWHGNFSLRGVGSGKCLDVAGAATGNGSAMQIWDCHGGGNQTWGAL